MNDANQQAGQQEVRALDRQVGGNHYKHMAIQPAEYCHRNSIPKLEGDVIAYVSRWRLKGYIQDLEKAKHTIELIIELEKAEIARGPKIEQAPQSLGQIHGWPANPPDLLGRTIVGMDSMVPQTPRDALAPHPIEANFAKAMAEPMRLSPGCDCPDCKAVRAGGIIGEPGRSQE